MFVSPNSAAKPHQTLPLKIIIQAKYIGAIIGHGGSTIREIAKTSQAKCVIDVQTQSYDELGNQENTVVISGTPDSCSKACVKILQITHSELERERGNGTVVELKIRVLNELIGRLIGKGGSSVKSIMEATGAIISINKANQSADYSYYLSADRSVTIRGNSLEVVSDAERKVSQKLRNYYESDVAQIKGNRNVCKNGGGAVNLSPMMPFQSPLVFYNSPPMYAANGDYRLSNLTSTSAAGGSPSGPPMMLCQAPAYGPKMTVLPSPVHLKTRIHVPSNFVGSLIGSKGNYIRSMTQSTGATISIESTDKERRRTEQTVKSSDKTDGEIAEKESANLNASNVNHPTAAADSAESTATQSSTATDEKEKRHSAYNTAGHNNNGTKTSDAFVMISGLDYQVLKAEFWIYQRIAESSMRFFEEVSLTAEVFVPNKIVGRIIGKNGQNMRELQRITRASVRMLDEAQHQNQSGSNATAASDGLQQYQQSFSSSGNAGGHANAGNEETAVIVTGVYYALQAVQSRFSLLIAEFEQRELIDQYFLEKRSRNFVGQHKSHYQPDSGRQAGPSAVATSSSTDREEATLVTTAGGDGTPPTAELEALSVGGEKAESI